MGRYIYMQKPGWQLGKLVQVANSWVHLTYGASEIKQTCSLPFLKIQRGGFSIKGALTYLLKSGVETEKRNDLFRVPPHDSQMLCILSGIMTHCRSGSCIKSLQNHRTSPWRLLVATRVASKSSVYHSPSPSSKDSVAARHQPPPRQTHWWLNYLAGDPAP